MKPALVLGLAFAANAMAANQGDNELIMAPTDKFSRDLVQRSHGKIMFDEVADDELRIRPISVLPESIAADDELSFMPIPPKVFVNRDWIKTAKIPATEALIRDDEADDELAVMLRPKTAFKSEEEYQKYYARSRYTLDDAADDELGVKYVHLPHVPVPDTVTFDDDELLVSPPRDMSRYGFDASGHVLRDNIGRPVKPVLSRFDEIADDELAVRNPTPEQYQRLQHKSLLYKSAEEADDQLWDEAADDELGLKFVHLPVAPAPEIAAYDDNELAVALAPRSVFKTDKEYQDYVHRMRVHFDDAADDELGLRIVHRPMADNHPYSFDDNELRIRPISVLPESIAADDELSLMPIPPKIFANLDWVKTAKFPVSEARRRDDEADDELAYLGQLITDRAFVPRTFDDDEFRAEKPSHIKAEERAQMKKELPKRQRKLRPHPDVIPMAEN